MQSLCLSRRQMETDDPVMGLVAPKWRTFSVIAAACVIQFTNGLVYTFGNMLPYLASYLRWKVDPQQTQGSLIWLQSLMSGLPFSMLAGGFLERAIGARWGAALGCTIYTGGLALSAVSIKESYALLILTLGLVSSFGNGLSYNCVLIQSQKWLPGRVGLVSGLITAGFGSGAFLISPLQTKYINPDNLNVDEDGFFTQEELLLRVPRLFLVLAALFGTLQFFALFFIAEPVEIGHILSENSVDQKPPFSYARIDEEEESEQRQGQPFRFARAESISSHSSYCPTAHYATPTSSPSSILCSSTFFCIFFTLLLNAIWCQTISGLFKAYGQTFIHDDFFLATINSFAAIFNCISRISWGAFADKTSYQVSMSIACAVGAALMWTLGLVKETGSPMFYFIWICAMFCCVGATYSLVPYATHRCFGSDKFGIAYGCIQLSLFLSGIITALSSQFILQIVGFQILFTGIAATMFISLLITFYLSRTRYGSSAA